MITEKSKLKDILKQPGIKGFEHMVRVSSGIPAFAFSHLSFLQLQKMSGWDATSIAEGMRYLEQKMKEPVFHHFWSEAERKKDPAKQNTGLAAFPTGKKSKYVVLVAGGSYQVVCSFVESYPLVERLNKMGYSVFVLCYRAGKNGRMPNPVEDLAQGIRYITEHADEFMVETEKYAVMGASAGGHAVAALGTKDLGYGKYKILKPGCLWLAYPVISYSNETDHSTIKGMRRVSLGKEHMDDPVWQERYSIEKHVMKEYPPTFIWQCEEDAVCPFINSKVMTEAMKVNGVPYRYETYPGKAHGWGVADRTLAEGWVDRAAGFWEEMIGREL